MSFSEEHVRSISRRKWLGNLHLGAIAITAALLSGCGTTVREHSQGVPANADTAPQTRINTRESRPSETRRAAPAAALNPDVHQDTIGKTICVPGYTASVRPSTTLTNGVKAKLLREAGLDAANASQCELDHRVALSVGRHPRALINLELQRSDGPTGAKRKDQFERRLQRLVCQGKMDVAVAQSLLYWTGRLPT